MDWSAPTLWWLVVSGLVAAELATGTFYLLMLALGCAAGALTAHAGLGSSTQVVLAALVGGAATVAWHLQRRRQPGAPAPEANRDLNLDIGQHVQVPSWSADGTARVQYRGAAWSVRLVPQAPRAAGEHVVVAVRGTELQVAPTASP